MSRIQLSHWEHTITYSHDENSVALINHENTVD